MELFSPSRELPGLTPQSLPDSINQEPEISGASGYGHEGSGGAGSFQQIFLWIGSP